LEVQIAVARLAFQRSGELAAKPDPEGSRAAIADAREVLRRAAAAHVKPPGDDAAPVNIAALSPAERARRVLIGELFGLAVSVELQAGDLPAAEGLARRGTAAVPENPAVWLALVDVQLRRGDTAAVEDELGRLQAAGYPLAPLDYHRARVLVLRGEWLAAARLLDEAIRDPDALGNLLYPARLLAGGCYEELGELDRRLEHYRAATAVDPREPLWFQAVGRYAATLAALGQAPEAIRVYQGLAARAAGANVPLARLLIAATGSRPPADRDWKAVETVIRGVPESVDAAILRAELAAAREDPAGAREALRVAIEKYPKEPAPILALAVLEHRQNAPVRAAELIAEAKTKFGDRVDTRLTQAIMVPNLTTPAGASTLASLAGGTEAWPAADRRRLLRGLASLARAAGTHDLAARLYDRLIDVSPSDMGALLARFDLAIRLQDEPVARIMLDRIQAGDGPTGAATRSARASLLIWLAQKGDRSGLAEAADLLQAVQKQRPWWGRVVLAQALVSDLNRDYPAALSKYREAFDAGERQPETVHRLLELCYELQRYRDAESLFRRLPGQDSFLSGDELLVAELSARSGNFPRALEFAARAIPDDSTDARRLIWLAQLRRLGGRPNEEIERPLRRAVAVGGNQPATWVALIQWLAAVGRKSDGESALAEAEQKLSGPGKRLAVAECRDALGQVQEARAAYEAALAENPQDLATLRAAVEFGLRTTDLGKDRLQHVRSLCQRILDLKNLPPDDQQFAFRAMAIVLTVQDDPDARRQGLELAGVLERGGLPTKLTGAESLPQLRTRVVAFALQSGPVPRREAIAALEAIESRVPLTPDEQFLLARLYATSGHWNAAKGRMGKLLQTDPNNLLLATYYGFGLLNYESDTREARRCLAVLEKAEPDTDRTIALSARILDSEGKPAEAAAVAIRPVGKDPRRALFSAVLLEQLGQPLQAEPLFRKLAAGPDPQMTLALAGFLARQGKTTDSLALIRGVADKVPPKVAAATGVAALFAAETAEMVSANAQQVQTWIAAITVKSPADRSDVLELTALLRTIEGRYPEAIQAYRELILARPTDPLQMNNLAYLLAMHEQKFDEATALLDRAKKLPVRWSVIQDTEAVILLEQKQTDRATEIFSEVAKGSPSGTAFFHLALAMQANKDLAGCIRAMKEAKRLRARAADLVPAERGRLKDLLKLVP
jgi:tetratricopeptide (TPR) repeat protein